MHVPLTDQVDIAGFHNQATRLLGQRVPPDAVQWSAGSPAQVQQQLQEIARASIHSRAARAIVPQSFVRLSELVVLHRDAGRFDLLYRSLWRLVYEPGLRHDLADADLARLRQMAQAVRRDLQRMKTHVSFEQLLLKGRPVSIAWYEPTHFVCEAFGGWLAKRDPASAWVLLTPERSLRWDSERLLAAPGLAPDQRPGALTKEGWLRVLESLPWL